MTIEGTAETRVDRQIRWDRDNRWARKKSQNSEDGGVLNNISFDWLTSKPGMDEIALCAEGCGNLWTDDLARQQRALLRGATPDVLVCDACFAAIEIGPISPDTCPPSHAPYAPGSRA